MVAMIIILISVVRIGVGVAPFIAGKSILKVMKLPLEGQNSSTLVMTRLFGVRDVGLGVLTLLFMHHTPQLFSLLMVNLCMDAGDLFSFLLAWKSDTQMKASAISSGGVAMLAVAGWVVALVFFVYA